MKNYYNNLNISPSSTQQEIKIAYRKLAMKWHPDRNINNIEAESIFKEIQEAYSVLSNLDKKKHYDFLLNSENKKDTTTFYKIFNSTIVLEFWEAVYGCTKIFEIFIENNIKLQIKVNLQQGLNDGETILIEVNNLIVQVKIIIKKDPYFYRKNLDLYLTINIPFYIAALGGEMTIPYINENLLVFIPRGIINNQEILITNKGIKRDIFIGDLYLICNIIIPNSLTEKQIDLLNLFQDIDITKKVKPTFFNNFKSKLMNLFKF